jgi:hypothetical protein
MNTVHYELDREGIWSEGSNGLKLGRTDDTRIDGSNGPNKKSDWLHHSLEKYQLMIVSWLSLYSYMGFS